MDPTPGVSLQCRSVLASTGPSWIGSRFRAAILASRFPGNHKQSVAQGEQNGGDTRIGHHRPVELLNGCGGRILRACLEDFPAPENVIDEDHPLWGQQLEPPAVIRDIIDLIRIDEN